MRLKVSGERGKTIVLRFGEILDENGNLYTENLRSARQTDYYTLKGDPDGETYESRFTFHGFRYVQVNGLTEEPTSDMLTAIVLHSDNSAAIEFECSDPLVNQLQHNIQWGWKGNSVDVPTDCPQRDERLGWSGEEYNAWSDRLLADGFALVVPTRHGDETVARFAFVNPRTTVEDVTDILDSMR